MSNVTYLDYFIPVPTCATVKQCARLNNSNQIQVYDYDDCWEEEYCPPPPWCRTSVRNCFIDVGGCQDIEQCPENPTDESQLFSFSHNYTESWRQVKITTNALRCAMRCVSNSSLS